MILTRTIDPTEKPVSLADLKRHARVDFEDDDAMLSSILEAAIGSVEEMSGRALSPQTWAAQFATGSSSLRLGRTPVMSLTSVSYQDADDAPQTISTGNFYVIAEIGCAYLCPKSTFTWPAMADRPDALTVTYQAGYTVVPHNLRSAILMMASHLYQNREATGDRMYEVPLGVSELIGLHRTGWLS